MAYLVQISEMAGEVVEATRPSWVLEWCGVHGLALD
jgi:hypothetical protein